jgi:L-seryl-tRNA(Ser) seleniumtransferase
MEEELRKLPSVDEVVRDKRLAAFVTEHSHDQAVALIREVVEEARQRILGGGPGEGPKEIVAQVLARISSWERKALLPVINATGVILHTNLGRAPLGRDAATAMSEAGAGYCNLEFELESGNRGSRDTHVEKLLCQLTGAEAAMVVNNNAAAVLLALIALARRREVIVSRGQAIEIGGGFRIPDVMRQSGAKLVEVGTTNCTYITDFEEVISPRTVALMRVHSSNFRVLGYTSMITLEEMVAVGKRHDVAVIDDLGSGCFLDTAVFGLEPEPMVQQSVAAGAELVLFSGDKLVGGPQAGIIVGRKELVDRLRKHPLARAVRIDKARLAGLIATMIVYLKGEALSRIPIWRMISAPVGDIDRRARGWAEAAGKPARVTDGESMVGGGSLPGGTLPTRLVAIGGRGIPSLGRRLRLLPVPVIGRISEGLLLLDPRSVLPEDDEVVVKALKDLAL